MNRRTAWTAAAAGGLLLVAAPLVWFLSQPPDQVGDLDAATRTQVPEVDAEPEEPTLEVETTDTDAAELERPPVTLQAGEITGPLSHHAAPTRLEIPSLGVDAPVVPVALEPDGAMEIPEDVNVVGWYEPGVRPGQEGTAVLSGHVDSREQGRGVLYDLRTSDVGDLIVTSGERGEPVEWRVVARTRYGKAELPIADIFVRDGPTRLVVITCGGEFDAATRSYSENIVVYAELA